MMSPIPFKTLWYVDNSYKQGTSKPGKMNWQAQVLIPCPNRPQFLTVSPDQV